MSELADSQPTQPPAVDRVEAAKALAEAAKQRVDGLPSETTPTTTQAQLKTLLIGAESQAKLAANKRELATAAMKLALSQAEPGKSGAPGSIPQTNGQPAAPDLVSVMLKLTREAEQAEEGSRQAKERAAVATEVLRAKEAKVAADEAVTAAVEVTEASDADREAKQRAADHALAKAERLAAVATDSGHEKPADKPPDAAKDADSGSADRNEDAEKELDRLKSGKLIAWGVTAGVAPAFFQPMTPTSGTHAIPGMGAVTYIMLLPGYWRNNPEANIYCANKWGGRESEAAAARAADAVAAERAELIVDRLLDQARAGGLRPGDAATLMCSDGLCSGDETRIRELTVAALGSGETAKAARRVLIGHVQRKTYGWTSGITTGCGSRRIGLWLGYPLKFSATLPYRVDMQVRRERMDVTPLFAGGLAWSPNAYISLLAGISLGKVNLPPGTDKDDELVASFVFGLGGNLDLVGFLTK